MEKDPVMERRDLEVGIQETPHQELKQQRRQVGINKPTTHLFKDSRGLKAKCTTSETIFWPILPCSLIHTVCSILFQASQSTLWVWRKFSNSHWVASTNMNIRAESNFSLVPNERHVRKESYGCTLKLRIGCNERHDSTFGQSIDIKIWAWS